MSTSISTRSGTVFTLLPPRTRFGENVVWVEAWAIWARPRLSMCAAVSSTRAGSVSAAASSRSGWTAST